MTIGGQGHLK